MHEETVNPSEEIEQVEAAEQVEAHEESAPEETKVPLSALQKERKKRQEMEIENRLLKEQYSRKPEPIQEQDDSQYESLTKAEFKAQAARQQREILRQVEESRWIKENPERYEKVTELLPEFLKRRPNLASAIEAATNRYEEAFELMDKLSPKEQQKLKTAPVKKDTPGSPVGAPKAASALAEAVDVMTMSDAEFARWRAAKKRAR